MAHISLNGKLGRELDLLDTDYEPSFFLHGTLDLSSSEATWF